MKDLNEIGIFICLPENIYYTSLQLKKIIKKKFNLKDDTESNIFHISLFQIAIERNNFLELIEKINFIIKNVEVFPVLFNKNLDYISNNIFWKIKPSKDLIRLHLLIIKNICHMRKNILSHFHDQLKYLSFEQKKILNYYGTLNVHKNYQPHITLFYGKKFNYMLDSKIHNVKINLQDLKFVATTIGIGEIGYYGNVINVIRKINLIS